MPVQQHVLNWLYSVLTSEYHDVNRTYNDVARVLNAFPTLAPRTDVHTFSNGTSALLLHVSGTIPVVFRGSTYRFPLSIWVPHAYPREPPLVYVTPTQSMVVRPGQHVDPQGQVYHPYLVRWSEFWDKSTLQDFLAVLTDVFAKESPVISRQASKPAQPAPTPPPVPPLPPEMAAGSPLPPRRNLSELRPPPPPAKPSQDGPSTSSSFSPRLAASGPAPMPSRYDSAPPLPPEARAPATWDRGHPQPQQQAHLGTHLSPQQHLSYEATPPHADPRALHHPQNPAHDPGARPPPGQWHPQGTPPVWDGAAVMRQQPPPPPPPPAPAPNILDEPLTAQEPAQSTIAAPPIPPNPEKDALLRQLAQTLASMRQRSRQQNESSMSVLKAQRMAMQGAMPALQSEMSQLTQLSNLFASNTHILREALHKADGVIEGSKNHPAPDVDELLVAPTVASNQLYTLVAEERALGDAIFMLGRAVERGRIAPAVFAKMTRSLAREWYLKKALARKIGAGMGIGVA